MPTNLTPMSILPESALANSPNLGSRELIEDLKNLVGALQREWRMIAIAVLVCLTLAALYLARTKRVYQATARVLVLQQGGRPLNMANNETSRLMEGNDDYIPTHALILSSPLVVKRAIDVVGLNNLPSLLTAEQEGLSPVEKAIDHLKVTRPDRLAKILRIEYRAGSRDEATRMLEAIEQSYQKFLESSFQENSSEVISLITKARDDLGRELKDLEVKYLEFRQKTAIMAVDETGRAESFISRRLALWDRAANEAMVKAIQLKSQLELGRKLGSQGIELWAVAYAINQVGGDSSSLIAALTSESAQNGAADYIRQLTQEQQRLAERYGPQYAKVRELQAQIARIRERTRDARSCLEGTEIRDLLESIDQSLKSVEAMRAELSRRFDQDRGQAKQIEIDLLTEENLRGNLERQRSLFNTVVGQLKQAQFVSDFNSISAQTIEPALALRNPVWPRVSFTLALALMAGCLLGGGAAVVVDRLDQRIRSLEELRAVLGLSVLGQIPQARGEQVTTMGEFGLVSHAMPRSPWAEAYKAVRTNLEFLRRNQRLQVILVASPHPGDGKSTSASNLAISLALVGRKVLLIDGDIRKPSQHAIHNLPNNHGLTHILEDLLPIQRVVQHSSIENLDLITTGPDVPNPAELLTSPRLGAFFDEVRQSYDLVIIDSSALLAVTDPAIVGVMADGIVLVVRPSSLRHHEAERTMELLRTLGSPILGLLINGIRREDSGYGHGYGYGEHRPDRTSQSTGGEDRPPVLAARSQPQANGQPGPGSHEELT